MTPTRRAVPCPRCQGSGRAVVAVLYGERYGLYRVECLACHATGQVSEPEAARLSGELATALAEMDREVKRLRWMLMRHNHRLEKGAVVEIVVAGVRF